jgi:hypothetical protein
MVEVFPQFMLYKSCESLVGTFSLHYTITMTLTVCFDVLHSSFSLEPLENALDKAIGTELREKGSGARMVVMDWFHCAQRDFAVRPAPQSGLARGDPDA